MRTFKFFQKEKVFSEWMDQMDDYHLGGIMPMRWVGVDINNLQFRVYTNLSMGEVHHAVHNIIEPFIFEHNNQNNRNVIHRMLSARFHRAQMVEDEGL